MRSLLVILLGMNGTLLSANEPAPTEYREPSTTLVNFEPSASAHGLSPTCKLGTGSVVGQNLLHNQHPEFGTPGASRVEIGRSIFARIALRY